MNSKRLASLMIVLILVAKNVVAENQPFSQLTLENEQLQLAVTPEIGGRISYFGLKSHQNFLQLGNAFTEGVRPEISAFSDNIGYLGHTIWVGPQSEWWLHQQLNLERQAANAQWPPDPFTIFATNNVKSHNKNQILLEGIASPITGLKLDKAVYLTPTALNQVTLTATATNISDTERAWDLWFNSRVFVDTYIVAPVADQSEVRITHATRSSNTKPIEVSFTRLSHINADKSVDEHSKLLVEFTIDDIKATKDQHDIHQGKIFIQPSQGWLAGFNDGQLFIIEFPWQPQENIHPEQGQIEVYVKYDPKNVDQSLLEMEFHGPYQTLQPKQQMAQVANWHLFPYPKNWNKAQMRRFLLDKLTSINI